MLLLLPKEKLEVNLMLSFKALEEKKKTNIKINPKKNDLLEKQKKHPEDCPGCEKCEDEKEEKVVEGTAYGLYKGDGKPKGVYDLKKKKKEKKVEEATLATARKNIGRDPKKKSCWDGYKATGTKMKGGKAVPDCKKEGVADAVLSGTYHQIKTGAKLSLIHI